LARGPLFGTYLAPAPATLSTSNAGHSKIVGEASMKRLILLGVVVVGGAFYLGWFTFTTDSSGPSEHVNIVIDKDKVHADEARAVEKLRAFEQQVEVQGQNASQGMPPADRSARRANPAQQYDNTQPTGYDSQPAGYVNPPTGGYGAGPGGQRYEPPAGYGGQPAGYGAQQPAQPAPGPDPYELPEDESRPVARPAVRPAGGGGSDFSRGFE
jgi:hypothetical protein